MARTHGEGRHAKAIRTVHYKPADGFFGDPVPFWQGDSWHIFFVKIKPDNSIVLGHVETRDFVHWEEHRDALETGSAGSPDQFMCATGSVVEKDGVYHLFYTGAGEGGYNLLKATSTDLDHWTKETRPVVQGGQEWYRQDGLWRDPCVVWNPEEQCWWMAFCTRVPPDGANFMPGAVGLAKSDELATWRLCPPAWSAGLTGWVECPDIFPHGGKWVLSYSWRETVFRIAESPSGPWRRLQEDAPSGLDVFAGKSATDGRRRILFAQVPRKVCDCSARIGGGDLAIPREFVFRNGEEPRVQCPGEVESAYAHDATDGRGAGVFETISGHWEADVRRARAKPDHGGALLHWPGCPADYLLGFTIRFEEGRGTLSVYLRLTRDAYARDPYSTAADLGYELLLDAFRSRVCLREHYEYNQKPDIASLQYDFGSDRRTECRVFVDGSILEVFIGRRRSMTARLMSHPVGGLALVARDGSVSLDDFTIRTLA